MEIVEVQLAVNVEAVERGVPRAAAITVRFHCSCSNASSVTTWGAIRALVPALHFALVLTKILHRSSLSYLYNTVIAPG